MSFVNYHSKEINFKIVYFGPSMGGKTASLKYIYNKTAEQNDDAKMITLDANDERTLFFDFLPLDYGNVSDFKVRFHLYTIPGETFYSSVHKIILKGIDGIIFVADSRLNRMEENIKSLKSLEKCLADYSYNLKNVAMAMQFNKRDLINIMSEYDMHKQLNKWDVPVFNTAAIKGEGIMNTLNFVAYRVIMDIKNCFKNE